MEIKVLDRDITSANEAKSGTRYVIIPKRMSIAMGMTKRVEVQLVEMEGETRLIIKPFVV